eukprot:gene25469-11129_t
MPAPRGNKPSLVDHLNLQAPKKPVSAILSLSKYYVAADLLLRQAHTYRAAKNDEQLYVILMRFASLILETIPSHHDFKKANPDSKYMELKKSLMARYMSELEAIRVSLQMKDMSINPVAHSKNRPPEAVQLTTSNLPGVNWSEAGAVGAVTATGGYGLSTGGYGQPPAPQFLVDDLLEIVNGGPTGAPASGATRTQSQPPSSSATSPAPPPPPAYQAKYSLPSADAGSRHALYATKSPESSSGRYQASPASRSSLMPYPQLDRLSVSESIPQPPPPPPPPHQPPFPSPSAGPSLGPQELEVVTYSPRQHLGHPVVTYSPYQHLGHPGNCSQPPPPPPPDEPPSNQLAPSYIPPPPPPDTASSPGGGMRQIEKKAQLRDVHISLALMEDFLHFAASNTRKGIESSLMEDFLHFAASNTRKGIESCGILGGSMSADDSIFTINSLIIPKQEGTTDTVQALNEEEQNVDPDLAHIAPKQNVDPDLAHIALKQNVDPDLAHIALKQNVDPDLAHIALKQNVDPDLAHIALKQNVDPLKSWVGFTTLNEKEVQFET